MRRFCIVGAVLAAVIVSGMTSSGFAMHERKEVAGMLVVFGAEPEPALTQERQELVWRFRGLESEEAVPGLEELQVVVAYGDNEYGPFAARGSRREPGTYRAMRIFTEAGEYKAALTFNKPGETERHTVHFDFRINDRVEVEIPGSRDSQSLKE